MSSIVLVPLDGSDEDPRALAVAVAAADLTGGVLELVRVIPPSADGDLRAAAEQ